MSNESPIKTALLFPWCPEVDGGHLIETSARPEVAMRLEYVELLDGWRIEGLTVGGHGYIVSDPDLRPLGLPPVAGGSSIQVTIRARNTSADRQRFPGAKIIGAVIQ
jgi:hypothetical protein